MISLIAILIGEYVGDFLLQSRHTALNKSKDKKIMFDHLLMIFICIVLFGSGLGMMIIPFALLYCIIHGIQDWYIWNGYKWIVYRRLKDYPIDLALFEKEREYAVDKTFYDFIGLDRLLHIITLFILYGIFFL